jgi:hypothetical protein
MLEAQTEIKCAPEQPQLKGFRHYMQDDFNPPEGAFSQKNEETCTDLILFAFIRNANLENTFLTMQGI